MLFKTPVTAYFVDQTVSLFFCIAKTTAAPQARGMILMQKLTPPLNLRANKADIKSKRAPRTRRQDSISAFPCAALKTENKNE